MTMPMMIALLLDMFCTYLLYAYLTFYGKEEGNWKDFFLCAWEKKIGILSAVCFCAAFGVLIYGRFVTEDSWLQCCKNMVVLHWLFAIGFIDWKEKIIPNVCILAGIAIWLGFTVLEIVLEGTLWSDALIFSLIGGAAFGLGLMLIALVMKNALGMGDVKMFAVIGLFYGVLDTYSILLFTILIMAAVSIVLLIAKKVTAKTSVPMAPFAVLGFLVCILIGM